MPVRLKITLLFALLVSAILMLLCLSIYYFSYTTRVSTIKGRLKNRAITTARLLGQSSYFDHQLLRRIDTSTALAMKEKSIQVYNYLDERIYWYADEAKDTISINKKVLDDARVENDLYFSIGRKDVIAHHHTDTLNRLVIVAAAYDEQGKSSLQQLSLILWLSFTGGILVSLAGGYFFSTRLLSPIKNIAHEVKEISAQSLTRRIRTTGANDEWQYLSATLNNLLNRLQNSFETQGRFISNASHELSTPLTAISSQLEVALQRERDPERYREILYSISEDIAHLNQLTKTLLEFAKASGSSSGLEIQEVRVDEVLMELPGYMKKINPEFSVTLRFQDLPADEAKLLVTGNQELLLSAIKNLVSNACKFAPDHHATVSLRFLSRALEIEVHNTGIPIPEKDLDNIFQPFYRATNNRAVAGFGLGLSLAKRIINLHKGNITAMSDEENGTRFLVTLPTGEQHTEKF
jgi:two-component system, OmpR family, sensor histidine kinase ArlS